MNPDATLFHFINDFAGTISALDWLARLIVNDLLVPTIMALAVVWLWFAGTNDEERKQNKRTVLIIAIALLCSQALIKDMSLVYFRPRPFAVETVNLLFYRPSVSSFPSVPATMAFCFAAGALIANRRVGIAMLLLAFLYALARVYAGVHYPSDVVAGALLGTGMVKLVARLDTILEPLMKKIILYAERFYFA